MPTYESRCDGCGDEFDLEQRITDAKLKKCPKCKKMKLVRLIGTGNFILKGGGWYADLYSGASNKKSEPPSKSETKSSEAKSDSSSSKSETKSDGAKKSDPKKPAKTD
jgi:putative FmdB family regulatory protein